MAALQTGKQSRVTLLRLVTLVRLQVNISTKIIQTPIWLHIDLSYLTVEIRTGFGVLKSLTTRHCDRIIVSYSMPPGYGGEP